MLTVDAERLFEEALTRTVNTEIRSINASDVDESVGAVVIRLVTGGRWPRGEVVSVADGERDYRIGAEIFFETGHSAKTAGLKLDSNGVHRDHPLVLMPTGESEQPFCLTRVGVAKFVS